jgi:type II secretion system (T2SS) protein G
MNRIRYFIGLVLVTTVLLLAFSITGYVQARARARVKVTTIELMNYRAAITTFFGIAGRGPTSVTELITNSMGVIFIRPSWGGRDAWGREIIYEPYGTNTGRGRVLSYGRDGTPGGVGADADIEFTLP